MTTSTTSTYILDPFQRLIPHTTSSFKTKIKGLGGIRSVYTITSSTNYSTSTIIAGATKPLKYQLKVLSQFGSLDNPIGTENFFWNTHDGDVYVSPETIRPFVISDDLWDEMLGPVKDPASLVLTSSEGWEVTGGDSLFYEPGITAHEYSTKYQFLYAVRFLFDNEYIQWAFINEDHISNELYGNIGFCGGGVPDLYVGGIPVFPSPSQFRGGRFQLKGFGDLNADDASSDLILDNSYHTITAQIVKLPFPGRKQFSVVYGTLRTYPEIPRQETLEIISEISKTIFFTGSKNLTSSYNTGTVSSNTGSSTATSVELLYFVNNKRMSESIDVFASFSTGTSWANLWDLPNKFRSKSTSTGNLSVIAELKFNDQPVQMIKDKWPISSVGSKLIGKFYNTTDMKASNIPWDEKEGRLYVLNTVTSTETSQMSVVEFQRNSTNTVSINVSFTDDTGTIYTTSSSIIARWV